MDLELIRIFVKVIQYSSFSKAAEVLKMPKSTVSRSISRLERETGTRLLVRSTRSLTMTQAGQLFYEASLGPIHLLEEAQKSLYGKDNLLTGTVRITAPEDLGTFVIAPAIAKLSAQHPLLRFELKYTDTLIDLVKEGFDIAVRIGRMKDSGLKLKNAGEVILVPVASPTYLKGKEKIKSPKELSQHQCLTLDLKKTAKQWILESGSKKVQVPIQAKILSNQMSSLVRMALADGGIALVPIYICKNYLNDGRLVRVLPEWSNSGWPISILSPLAPSSSARLKITIDKIYEEIKATQELAKK